MEPRFPHLENGANDLQPGRGLEMMFVKSVAEAENLTIQEEEYLSRMEEYAKEMGLESESELVSYYDGVMDESDFVYAMLGEKVQKLVCDNIKIVPDTEKETTPGSSENQEDQTTAETK